MLKMNLQKCIGGGVKSKYSYIIRRKRGLEYEKERNNYFTTGDDNDRSIVGWMVEEKHQILEKQKKKKVQRKQSQQNLKKQILS